MPGCCTASRPPRPSSLGRAARDDVGMVSVGDLLHVEGDAPPSCVPDRLVRALAREAATHARLVRTGQVRPEQRVSPIAAGACSLAVHAVPYLVAHVVRPGAVLDVRRARVAARAVAMADLVTAGSTFEERLGNEDVHAASPRLPEPRQGHGRIPCARVLREHLATGRGAWQRPHLPADRHLVQALVPNHGPPLNWHSGHHKPQPREPVDRYACTCTPRPRGPCPTCPSCSGRNRGGSSCPWC